MIYLFGFSLRKKSRVISVDESIMEESAEIEEFRKLQSSAQGWKYESSEFSDTNGMIPELESIKSDASFLEKFQIVLAVGIHDEDYHVRISEVIRASQYNIGLSKYSGDDLIKNGWVFCGYDVADALQFSILNVRIKNQGVEVNQFGLIADYHLAKSFADERNRTGHDHAPFFPNAIYMFEAKKTNLKI
jgi:hypothetical protein